MRFEKWNALGNDYVIVEQDDLPFEITPERVRRICAPHSGVGSDGLLLLAQPKDRGFVAHLADCFVAWDERLRNGSRTT